MSNHPPSGQTTSPWCLRLLAAQEENGKLRSCEEGEERSGIDMNLDASDAEYDLI